MIQKAESKEENEVVVDKMDFVQLKIYKVK